MTLEGGIRKNALGIEALDTHVQKLEKRVSIQFEQILRHQEQASQMLNRIDHLERNHVDRTPNRKTKLWACADCGCTDVHQTAWIEVNTGLNTGEEGPLDAYFCPQCEANGDEGINAVIAQTADHRQSVRDV